MWKFDKVVFNKTHAQLPTAIKVGDSTIRLYFCTKLEKLSNIFFVDLDCFSLEIKSDVKLVLSPGVRGSFDQAGVMPSCIVNGYMYYTGWSLRNDVPYTHAIGMAKILPDGGLERIYDGPILSVNRFDKFLVNSPCVIEANDSWHMYYSSGTGWHENYPSYCIKKATSLNGINWFINSQKEITFNLEDEAISRVCYDSKMNTYYFSMRTKETSYHIYYLEEGNKPKHLNMGTQDWDSKMQCYPFIYDDDGLRYMFYNGNGYGETGIGVAKWITDIV